MFLENDDGVYMFVCIFIVIVFILVFEGCIVVLCFIIGEFVEFLFSVGELFFKSVSLDISEFILGIFLVYFFLGGNI